MITTWWAGLSLAMKMLWGVTLVASLIFVVQSVMTFLGADADSGMDIPDDASGLPDDLDGGTNLYTFRNFVNFFLGFGWSAILLQERIHSTTLLVFVSILVGIALVAAVMFLFKWLSSMQQSGTIDLHKSAVGCSGKCYIPIPAARSGEGQVQIVINGTVREYGAVTDGDAIPTGTPIKVLEVLGEETLLVEAPNSLII